MKKEINVQIGARVRRARKRLHLTREELAEALDVSTLFVGYIECGQKGMSLETFRSMCRTLHVSADYLLFGDESDSSDAGRISDLVGSVEEAYHPLLEQQLQLFLKTIRLAQEAPEQRQPKKARRKKAADEPVPVMIAARDGSGQPVVLDSDAAHRLQTMLDSIDGSQR